MVGDKTKTWVLLFVISTLDKAPIVNVAVLPVPDCAWAITSFPEIIGLIAFCWIGLGFSKPYPKIPLNNLGFMSNSSQDLISNEESNTSPLTSYASITSKSVVYIYNILSANVFKCIYKYYNI